MSMKWYEHPERGCRGLHELFTDPGLEQSRLIALCEKCPVLSECRTEVIELDLVVRTGGKLHIVKGGMYI